MAAGHTWNGITFDDAVVVGGVSDLRETLEFDFPGVDGVELVDMGWRGRTVELRGRKLADDVGGLKSWFEDAWGKCSEAATLELYGCWPLEHAVLSLRFTGLRPASGGGYYGFYRAAFRQLEKE